MICLTGILSDLVSALVLEDVTQEPLASILILYSEIFSIGIGVFYCTVFERRNLRSIGFDRPIGKPYGMGLVIGGLLISLVVLISMFFGGIRFSYINTKVSLPLQLLLLGGFIVQGMSEEVLCRGYIFVSMARKNSILAASLGSSVLFSMIHVFNDGFSFLPLLNLILFGILESLLFLKTNSIWLASAVHSVWNYMQGCVFGLSISGSSLSDSFLFFEQTDKKLINGGTFGPEGSIVTTIVLLAAIAIMLGTMRQDIEKKRKNG